MKTILELTQYQNLSEYFKNLTNEEIFNIFHSDISMKGLDYYKKARVSKPDVTLTGGITCKVIGSNSYQTEIAYKDNSISAKCNCPYGGTICKHISATFFYLSDLVKKNDFKIALLANIEVNNKENKLFSEDEFFCHYLEALPKNELVNLILEFAPEDFKKKIIRKNVSDEKSEKIISNVRKKLEELFPIEGMSSADDVEDTLKDALEEIESFFKKESETIMDILLFCYKELYEAQDQGLFYDDDNDGNFDYYSINEFTIKFLKSLDSDKKIEYSIKILENSEYSDIMYTLDDDENFFTKEEKIKFKPFLFSLSGITEDFYKIFKSVMNDKEKETFLQENKRKEFYCDELVFLYEEKKELKKLAIFLEECINDKTYFGDKFLYNRMLIAEQLGEDKFPWLEKFISKQVESSSLHDLFKKHIPQEKKEYFESISKKNNLSGFIGYLELENRLNEAINILQENKDLYISYDFFRKHKEKYPNEARKIFEDKLDANLEYTGDRAYYKVLEILAELKPICSEEKFRILLRTIKTKYSRRRSLISMINTRFEQ